MLKLDQSFLAGCLFILAAMLWAPRPMTPRVRTPYDVEPSRN